MPNVILMTHTENPSEHYPPRILELRQSSPLAGNFADGGRQLVHLQAYDQFREHTRPILVAPRNSTLQGSIRGNGVSNQLEKNVVEGGCFHQHIQSGGLLPADGGTLIVVVCYCSYRSFYVYI